MNDAHENSSKVEEEEGELILDFTNIDRIGQHLKQDRPDSADELDLPDWFETKKDLSELYAEASLTKALKLVRNGRVKPAGRPGLYDVSGSEPYVCNVIEFGDSDSVPGITCTCPNGSNRSGRPTCYHSAAVLMVHTEADLNKIEKEIDGSE